MQSRYFSRTVVKELLSATVRDRSPAAAQAGELLV
jgi:hypothetical protein